MFAPLSSCATAVRPAFVAVRPDAREEQIACTKMKRVLHRNRYELPKRQSGASASCRHRRSGPLPPPSAT
jgi:hypothetical protein